MFEFFKTDDVGELVIIVLSGEFNASFALKSHVILGCPSKIRVDELKLRIAGVTKIPFERQMLLYCGLVLSDGKEHIPMEAFELSETCDEDTNTFKARICLSIMEPNPSDALTNNDDEDGRNVLSTEISSEADNVVKHRRKQRDKGEFNLELELSSINCALFTSTLSKLGYDNEGAFASLTLETIRGPEMWIPLGAAQRIYALCAQRKQLLESKDKASTQPHYRQQYAAATIGPETALDGAHHQLPVTKADARREYEQEIIRTKKVAREAAELLKSGKSKKKSDSLKEHSQSLRKKIESLKIRCAQDAEESSSEFDEITGILYGSYSRLRALNQTAEGANPSSSAYNDLTQRAGALGTKPSSASSVVTTGPGSPTKMLRAMRSSASQPALTSSSLSVPGSRPAQTTSSHGVRHEYPHIPSATFCRCCDKHSNSATRNREEYVAFRRVQHTEELRVQLASFPSAQSGFVTGAALVAVATNRLKSYHGMPRRSADPSLVRKCVDASRLTLDEQRNTILWMQREEVTDENLVSILPVTWHDAHRFVEAFTNILEELDRER